MLTSFIWQDDKVAFSLVASSRLGWQKRLATYPRFLYRFYKEFGTKLWQVVHRVWLMVQL